MDYLQKLRDNIFDESNLKESLAFVALFVALYENFADLVVDRVECFYSKGFTLQKDGSIKAVLDEKYNNEVKNRTVDDKGNKNVLKATLLWFKDMDAITEADYSLFLEVKEKRNKFVHRLTNVVMEGVEERDVKLFFEFFNLYKKLDRWWINEFEIPIAGEFEPGTYDENEVRSVITELYELMIGVLYLGKSEEYKTLISEYMGASL